MAFTKPSPELTARFQEVVPDAPGVQRKQMFGMPAAFVNGNMFAGLFEENMLVRLDEPGRAELEAAGGTEFAPMGRPMKEYRTVPPALIAEDAAVTAWIERALAFASAMPPKQPKARKTS
jgi:TfoX/Sxy family transcriptional regulator of competence genes